jgi:hypothetical protein
MTHVDRDGRVLDDGHGTRLKSQRTVTVYISLKFLDIVFFLFLYGIYF